MRLGFFIQPVHPPSRAYGDVLREDREAVALADRLGFHEAFIGEHRGCGGDHPSLITKPGCPAHSADADAGGLRNGRPSPRRLTPV